MLWTGAALFVLTAHVGVAAWLMREAPIVAADDAPPAAIMIEFAEEPEAVHTEENEISEQMENAEASAPAEEVEAPEEAPPEETAETPPEPVEQEATEAEPEEIVEEAAEPIQEEPAEETVQLPDAEVPLPTARPKPPEPKKEVVRREEPPRQEQKRPERQRPQQQQAASQTTRQAQAQVREGNRNAARQSASGVNAATAARWEARVMAHLERRKRYPSGARSRREQGVVMVRFSIDERGNVQTVALARTSGHPDLDNEVLALVRRASPVPAPPPGANRTITAPVRFNVR